MTLKQLIEDNLNSQAVLMQIANLQKVADAANKIPLNPQITDATVVQQADAFKKMVAQQLKQKQLQAQQLQAQQLQAQEKANQQINTTTQQPNQTVNNLVTSQA